MRRCITERRANIWLSVGSDNDLVLNTTKIKGITEDLRKTRKTMAPLFCINNKEVERVNKINFLRLHITKNLTWTLNSSHLVKKAQQSLFFMGKLKKAKLPSQLRKFLQELNREHSLPLRHLSVVHQLPCREPERLGTRDLRLHKGL